MGFYNTLQSIADWLWDTPMLILIVGGGLFLTIMTGGIQVRHLGYCLKHTIGDALSKEGRAKKEEGISGLQAVLSCLSGTIGTGNIVGVGAAIALGGPGAVFWMWVVGFVSMCVKYCEALSSVKFRRPSKQGLGYLYDAGPAIYLPAGVPIKAIGKFLGISYGIFVTWGLVMSGPEHTSAITDVFTAAFNVPKPITIAICVVIVGGVLLGGMKRFVRVSEIIVPLMSVIYIAFGLVIIIMNAGNLGEAFGYIFGSAFKGTAAVGGFAGAGLSQAIRWGVSRGVYSSDAGNGIQSIMHGQANVKHPTEQGMWAVFEVFVDTIVICTFTALIIMSTGIWQTGLEGSALVLTAFTNELGSVGTIVESICLFFFSITSAIGMAVFMDRHLTGFFNRPTAIVFDCIYLALMVVGGYVGFDAVLPITDLSQALEIWLNVCGILLMAGGIRATTKDYFKNHKITK